MVVLSRHLAKKMIKLFPKISFLFFEISLDFISCSPTSILLKIHSLLVIDGFVNR